MARVGLVLGAGGVLGAAYHAGVLAALGERGWDPRDAEVVVGTSAGSGTGAVLRAGLAPADFLAGATGRPLSHAGARLQGRAGPMRPLPTRPLRGRGFPSPAAPQLLARAMAAPWRVRPGVMLAGLLPSGAIDTDLVGARIRSLYGDSWPDRALWICAVRLRDGRLTVFGRDESPRPDVATAVEASSAIPGFFRPVDIGGDRYVDGGTHSPTNADLLAGLGLDVVIVSSPMSATRSALRARTVPDGRVLYARTLGREVAALRRSGAQVVTIQPTGAVVRAIGVNSMDPSRRAEVATLAHKSALAHLAERWPF